jgi:hypothetical protein
MSKTIISMAEYYRLNKSDAWGATASARSGKDFKAGATEMRDVIVKWLSKRVSNKLDPLKRPDPFLVSIADEIMDKFK